MPKPLRGHNKYADTGWPAVCSVAWTTSGGAMIGAPGTGKHVHILGVISYSTVKIKAHNSGGTTVMTLPGNADGLHFPGALDMGENTAVFCDTSDDVTIFYYIHDNTTE